MVAEDRAESGRVRRKVSRCADVRLDGYLGSVLQVKIRIAWRSAINGLSPRREPVRNIADSSSSPSGDRRLWFGSAALASGRPSWASGVKSVGGLHAGAARTTRVSGPNGGSSLISPGGGGVVSISPGFRLLPTSSGRG